MQWKARSVLGLCVAGLGTESPVALRFANHLIWLSIPFSALSAWIFTTMEKIGESSESPFEGSANDVPITAISRAIEIDLKEMYNMEDIPAPLKPENNILV